MSINKNLLLILAFCGSSVGGFAQLSANFTTQIACDRTVTFTNTSTGYTSVSWDFGDGTFSIDVNPVHQYGASGTFNVVMNITNGPLNTSLTRSIAIYDPPSQSITGNVSVCEGAQETYSVSTAGNNYQWAVTRGIITSGLNSNSITVEWLQAGTGVVRLNEQNASGCTSSISSVVTVNPVPVPEINLPTDQSGSTPVTGAACFGSTETYNLLPPLNPGSTYQWQVTGGDIAGTAQADEVSIHWTQEGTGWLGVTETTAAGCSATVNGLVEVHPAPVANFSTFDVCLGSEAHFTDLSAGDFTNWHWNFGDGNSSIEQNPSHVYAAAGTYPVTLTITNVYIQFHIDSFGIDSSVVYELGCPDDTTMPINIVQNPGPEITCPGTVCPGDEETYSTPAVAGASYIWSVSGGTVTGGGTTADNEITVDWGNGPVGIISLQITGAGNYCNIPSIVQIPIVSPNPQINGPTTACISTPTTYDAPLLPGAEYTWTVTGGSLSSGQGTNRITAVFNSPGTKTISLNVFHDLAECSGQDDITVQVLHPFNFNANPTVCAQSTATYSVSGTPAPAGQVWNWSVTGGAITSGQGTNSITVQWANGPVGEIIVNAPAGVYCNARERAAINIKPLPPPAVLNGALNVCASSFNTYYVPAGFYTTWTITGGTITSGGTAGIGYATVQWGNGPTGQITVVQEDRTLSWPYCSTTTNFLVSIAANTPLTISGPTPICTGFTGTYTTNGNPASPYAWQVTGGNIIAGFGTNSLTVEWGAGPWGTLQATELVCNNTDDLLVEITAPNPAMIDTAGLTCDGSSLTLFVPGDYAAFSWSTASVDSFTTITAPGTYSVSLTDAYGCTTEASVSMGAVPTLPVPVAFITGNGPQYSPFIVLELTAHPSNQFQYIWSTGATTESIYVTAVGHYFVTVTNDYGCTAAATVEVVVTPNGGLSGGGGFCNGGGNSGIVCNVVAPDFTHATCNPVQFTNTSVPPALAYVWDFGDGAYAWTTNPSHSYNTVGNHTVTLWATENGICWSSIQHTVNITSILHAKFNFPSVCFGDPIQFTDISTSALPITSWLWEFGDANTSASSNPLHTYAAPGIYNAKLTISDGVCSDVYQKAVDVRDLIAAFSYQYACFGKHTLFTDNSAGALQVVRWHWDFGDGSTSVLRNPAHQFATLGNHTVTLTVTDIAGCTASTTVTLDVIQFDAGEITYNGPTAFCEGEKLTLNAPVGAGYSYLWSTGEITPSIDAKEQGAYFVEVTNTTGCKDTTDPVAITVYPRPFAYITANGPLTFCHGAQNVALIANPPGPGFGYAWYKDQLLTANIGQSFSVFQPSHSGSYTFIVTDNHGCKDTSAEAVVTIFPNPPYPNIVASGPTNFCDGGSVTLSTAAGYQYEWSNGATTQSTTITSSGNYTVTITDANGCSSFQWWGEHVIVHPLPDMSLVAFGCYDICPGESNVIYGPPGMYYQWSTGATSQSINVTTAGTYSLTATSPEGCTNSSDDLYISTTNALDIDLGPDASFCDGGSVTFDAGAGYASYLWHDGSTNQTYTATVSETVSVDVADANGCTGTDEVVVTVFPNPVVDLQDEVRCDPAPVTLDAGAGFASYLWSDQTTDQTLTVFATGTYSVTVTDANGCTATDAANILFANHVQVNLGTDISLCGSGSATLDAGAGYTSYLWDDGSANQTYVVTATGTYSVTVTDANGCTSTDEVQLLLHPAPVVDLPDDMVLCDEVEYTLDAGAGNTLYQWSDNSTDQSLTVTTSGSYSVTITDANGCTATDEVNIVLAATSVTVTAGPNTTICAGELVQLSASGGVSYTWSPDATLNIPNSEDPLATPTSSTTYTVTIVDAFGCTRTATAEIEVLPLITAQVSADVTICRGESTQLIASGGTVYNWIPADGLSCTTCPDPVASPEQTTTYTVEVSQPGFCNSEFATVTVTVIDPPEAGLDSIITMSQGMDITFTPNSGMADYDWSAEGWTCDGCPQPTVSPVVSTLYTLVVTDENGCTSTEHVLLKVKSDCEGSYFIPTAFSPNGDGHNDVFRIIHPGDLQLIEFRVFNRWGEVMFETNDPDKGWDGMYKGVKQELNVFGYAARMTCGNDVKTVSGNVTLVH